MPTSSTCIQKKNTGEGFLKSNISKLWISFGWLYSLYLFTLHTFDTHSKHEMDVDVDIAQYPISNIQYFSHPSSLKTLNMKRKKRKKNPKSSNPKYIIPYFHPHNNARSPLLLPPPPSLPPQVASQE